MTLRDQLNRLLLNLYRPFLSRFPSVNFADLLASRYGVREIKHLSDAQLGDLAVFMKLALSEGAA